MKKKSIFLLLGLIVISILLTGCEKKTPATIESFTELMEKKGYKIVDIRSLEDYEEANAIVSAEIESNTYLEFFDMKTEEDAERFYILNENNYEKNARSHTSQTMGNYQKFTGIINNKYIVFARIDNTIIFSEVKPKLKNTINKLVKELGY